MVVHKLGGYRLKKENRVVITARPSYSRIKSALHAIDTHPKLELQIVVAASAILPRYGSIINYLKMMV